MKSNLATMTAFNDSSKSSNTDSNKISFSAFADAWESSGQHSDSFLADQGVFCDNGAETDTRTRFDDCVSDDDFFRDPFGASSESVVVKEEGSGIGGGSWNGQEEDSLARSGLVDSGSLGGVEKSGAASLGSGGEKLLSFNDSQDRVFRMIEREMKPEFNNDLMELGIVKFDDPVSSTANREEKPLDTTSDKKVVSVKDEESPLGPINSEEKDSKLPKKTGSADSEEFGSFEEEEKLSSRNAALAAKKRQKKKQPVQKRKKQSPKNRTSKDNALVKSEHTSEKDALRRSSLDSNITLTDDDNKVSNTKIEDDAYVCIEAETISTDEVVSKDNAQTIKTKETILKNEPIEVIQEGEADKMITTSELIKEIKEGCSNASRSVNNNNEIYIDTGNNKSDSRTETEPESKNDSKKSIERKNIKNTTGLAGDEGVRSEKIECGTLKAEEDTFEARLRRLTSTAKNILLTVEKQMEEENKALVENKNLTSAAQECERNSSSDVPAEKKSSPEGNSKVEVKSEEDKVCTPQCSSLEQTGVSGATRRNPARRLKICSKKERRRSAKIKSKALKSTASSMNAAYDTMISNNNMINIRANEIIKSEHVMDPNRFKDINDECSPEVSAALLYAASSEIDGSQTFDPAELSNAVTSSKQFGGSKNEMDEMVYLLSKNNLMEGVEFPPRLSSALLFHISRRPARARGAKAGSQSSAGAKSGRKSYMKYSNSDKINFFKLASKVGHKKAAADMNISWSTAKAWVKKDDYLKQFNNSYARTLECTLLV